MDLGGTRAAACTFATVAAWACGPGGATERPPHPSEIDVPDGFVVDVFAEGLPGVRTLAIGPDGALYAVQSNAGRIVRFPSAADGGAHREVLDGLQRPYGLAFRDDWMYVAETHRVVRYAGPDYGRSPAEIVVPDLPTGGHWTRELAFGSDGRLHVAVGSSCNVCEESDPRRAAVTSYDPAGGDERIVAVGLRNPAGLAVHPGTGALWASQNERDHLGDDLPPEELNVLTDGRDFGWPECYGQGIPNPEYDDLEVPCDGAVPPALEMQAHSAPLGMAFYTGDAFPEAYHGDLFLAFHGSWNRSVPTGYKLVRVRVEDGRPVGLEDFATGWLGPRGQVRGRPAYPVVTPDGSLLLSDDGSGRIWRFRYEGGS